MKHKRRGFSLIEVMVAFAILIIIIASVISVLSSTYMIIKNNEMRNTAKEIANYTLEYIRSRNVTTDNPLDFDPGSFGDSNHKDKAEFYLPGIVDLWDIPLACEGHPKGSVSSYEFEKYCINVNPAPPNGTFHKYPHAFYYSLQGFVSLKKFDSLEYEYPSKQDGNLYICNYPNQHHYHDIDVYNYNGRIVHTFNHIIWKAPLYWSHPDAIKEFTALPGYLPMVYTRDRNKTNPDNVEYNPFYTNNIHYKNNTLRYRGYRVLLSIAARSNDVMGDPDMDHVEYYDIKIVVLWKIGKTERSYHISSRIVTFGGNNGNS